MIILRLGIQVEAFSAIRTPGNTFTAAIKRCDWIGLQLLDGEPLNLLNVIKKFGVSRATARRDVRRTAEVSGFKLGYDPSAKSFLLEQ